VNGHPLLPLWKPYRRKRVKFALAVLRRLPDSSSPKGWTRYQVGEVVDIAACDKVHRFDRELQRLADTPHVNRCSDLRAPTSSHDDFADAIFGKNGSAKD